MTKRLYSTVLTCPRCQALDLRMAQGFYALSRADNKTAICSGCGVDEGLEVFLCGELQNVEWLECL
mgnify:CR=1 FL=1